MSIDKDPDFFIVGLQKCGTYWLTALLNAHPEITCLPAMYGGQTGVEEGRIFDMLASIDNDGGQAFKNSFLNHHNGYYADLVPLLGEISKEELFDKFKERYRSKLNKHRNKKLVGDKTTEYIFHLDMIDSFYPQAKKICIIRDPKDRIVSFYFHQVRKGRINEGKIYDGFIKEYCSDRIIKEYESMLSYNNPIHCLTYENLSKNTQDEVTRLLRYLEASTDGNIIECMIKEASIDNLRGKDMLCKESKGKKEGDEVTGSHYRKGIVGDWQNHLSNDQQLLIDDLLGELHQKIIDKYI